MDYVRRDVQECQLVEEAIDPDGMEGFGHVKEDCACQPLFAKVPGYPFNETGQLQLSAVSASKPKLLIPLQTAHAYFM